MLHGGKIIGEGGQACVLKPSLDGKADAVTKIESESTSIEETEISYYLREHDPKALFGIYSYTKTPNCKINATKILVNEGAYQRKKGSKCIEIAESTKRRYCAFSMEAYTHDLDVLPSKESVHNIYSGLINLWDAIEFFHSVNIIHGDIKGANIAYRERFSGKPGMFAFADWGWSIFTKTKKDCDGLYFMIYKDQKKPENMQKGYRSYAADYRGGIWAPYIFEDSAIKRFTSKELVRYNDVFSLTLFTKDCILDLVHSRRVSESSVKELLRQLNDILQYNGKKYVLSGKYVDVPVGVISEKIRGLLF